MTLKDLAKAYSDREYMNIPEHCWPKKVFRDNNANELTKTILAFFKINNIKAWRQASEGRFIQGKTYTNIHSGRQQQEKGMYIPRSKGAKGIGDVNAVHKGMFYSIEVKIGKDRQSDVQKVFQQEIEESGGVYMIAKNWDGFYEQFKNKLA